MRRSIACAKASSPARRCLSLSPADRSSTTPPSRRMARACASEALRKPHGGKGEGNLFRRGFAAYPHRAHDVSVPPKGERGIGVCLRPERSLAVLADLDVDAAVFFADLA